MDIKENFKKAKELIDSSQNILLTMHERMDGDDGGSVLALAHALKAQDKTVTCAIKKGVPPSLAFLPGSEIIIDDINPAVSNSRELETAGFDLLIACGCSSLQRTGSDNIINLAKSHHSEQSDESLSQAQDKGSFTAAQDGSISIINIDHHPDNQMYGHVNMVDAKKSSVAELVYDFFNFCKWRITKDIATCLLTGIVTDTGSFMHSNTQSSTLKAAAELMDKGALTSKIIKHTYKNKNTLAMRAWAKAISNSYFDEKNKIIFSVMDEEDLNEIGELPGATFDGLTETLNKVPEAKMAMFLRQDGAVIKGSLRSDLHKNVDVAKIAQAFGGGGHKLAAGFSVAGKLVKGENGKWRIE